MDKEERQLLLYEKFGSQDTYSHKIKCIRCNKVMIYCTDPIQDLDEITFICSKCRGLLP